MTKQDLKVFLQKRWPIFAFGVFALLCVAFFLPSESPEPDGSSEVEISSVLPVENSSVLPEEFGTAPNQKISELPTTSSALTSDLLPLRTVVNGTATNTAISFGSLANSLRNLPDTSASSISVTGSLKLIQQAADRVLVTESGGNVSTTPPLFYTSALQLLGVPFIVASGTTSTAIHATSFTATSGTIGTLAGTTLYGGTSVFENATTTALFASSFKSPSSTITTLASGSLFFGQGTGTNIQVSGTASSSNLFATTATFSSSTIGGKGVCLSDGTYCPPSAGAEADTLFTVTNRGSGATATLQLYGGFLASSSTVTSTFTVVGTTGLQSLTFTSATGSSFALTGRINSSLLPQTDLSYSLGSDPLRWNGVFGNVTSTNATTTALFATSLSATSGTIATLNSTSLNVSGVSALQNLTFTNGTSTGVFTFSTASGTTLNAVNGSFATATVAGRGICLSDGTGCPSAGAESDTLASVTGRGSLTNTTLQLYGGFIGASSTVTSTLTVLGDTSLQNVTFGNGTGSQTTSTALFSTSFKATSGTITALAGGSLNGGLLTIGGLSSLATLTFTNGTGSNVTSTTLYASATASTTNLFANAATFGALTVTGQSVCLANGSNCLGTPASTSTLQQVTSYGATTTNIIYAVNGVQALNLTATGTVVLAAGTTIGSQQVCLADGTNCPVGSGSQTLAQVTALGASATATLQLYGGFLASSSTVTSTFTVVGQSILPTVSSTHVTTTNLWTRTITSRGDLTASSTGNLDFQAHRDTGFLNVDAADIYLTAYNGDIVFDAATTLQFNGPGANVLFDSTSFAPTTNNALLLGTSAKAWGGMNVSSTANFQYVSTTLLTVAGQLVCLANGTNCPAGVGTPTLAQVTAMGASATATLQLYGGFIAASSTVTSSFYVVGDTTLTNATATALFSTSIRGTSSTITTLASTNLFTDGATSTALFATSFKATSSTIATLATGTFFFGQATGTNLFLDLASSTNLFTTNGTSTRLSWVTASGTTLNIFNINASGTVDVSSTSKMTVGGQNVRRPLFLGSRSAILPITAPAGTSTQFESSTNLVNYFGNNFQPSATSSLQWNAGATNDYAGGTFEVKFTLAATSTPTFTRACFAIQAMAIGDGEAFDTAFGTKTIVCPIINFAANTQAMTTSVTMTVGNSPSESKRLFFRVSRETDHPSDTNTTTIQFVEAEETYDIDRWTSAF